MIGIGRLKKMMRSAISGNRRSALVRSLHAATSFVESAYANIGSDFADNGEQALLEKLRGQDFRVAIDAGANYGAWTLEALARWPRCHLHAFEVAPETFKKLSSHLGSFQEQGRVTLNPVGLSDKAGGQEMYYYPNNPELTCDMPRHLHPSLSFEAKLATLDEYCESHGIDVVDFLKIDVEGAESKVLRGFDRYLRAQRVHCVQFEYGAFATQTRFLLGDFFSLLSDRYWMGKIYPGYVDFRDYDWTLESFEFSNYCCVSRLRPDLRDILAH